MSWKSFLESWCVGIGIEGGRGKKKNSAMAAQGSPPGMSLRQYMPRQYVQFDEEPAWLQAAAAALPARTAIEESPEEVTEEEDGDEPSWLRAAGEMVGLHSNRASNRPLARLLKRQERKRLRRGESEG